MEAIAAPIPAPPPPPPPAVLAAPTSSSTTMVPHTVPAPPPTQPYYAFITHSSAGLRDNQPPMIDNAGLARRRRRRTSQHDQAILEEEYRRCDRPDKARRREIAKMVEMGDKEVQIWFQNKRQSARRKLKPLLPHEVIPSGGAKSGCSSSPTGAPRGSGFMRSSSSFLGEGDLEGEAGVEEKKFNSSQNHGYYSQAELDTPSRRVSKKDQRECLDGGETDEDVGMAALRREEADDDDDGDDDEICDDELPAAMIRRRMSASHMRLQEALGSGSPSRPKTAAASTQPRAAEKSSGRAELLPPPPKPRTSSFTSGHPRDPPSELSEYIFSDPAPQHTPFKKLPSAGIFSLSSAKKPDSIASILAPPAPPPQTFVHPRRQPAAPAGSISAPPPPLLKRSSSSFLRLSTSLEGKAEVVIESEPTLPPPLLTPRKANAAGSFPTGSSSALRGRGSSTMKSSRVWEFYCDNRDQAPPQPTAHHVLAFDSDDSEESLPSGKPTTPSDELDDDASAALTLVRSRSRRRSLAGSGLGPARRLLFEDASTNTPPLLQQMYSHHHHHQGVQSKRKILTPTPPVFMSGKVKKRKSSSSTSSGGGAVLGEITTRHENNFSGVKKHHGKKLGLGESTLKFSNVSGAGSGVGFSSGKKRPHRDINNGGGGSILPSSNKKKSAAAGTSTSTSTSTSSNNHNPLGNVKSKEYGAAVKAGEDYYIQGGESDKENYGSEGEKNRDRGEEEMSPPPEAVKKRKVVGGGGGGRGVQVDEEGAELLLSLSAGRWGA
ncbi:hypothetical protein DFH27DRAFT_106013 [Peziza echinospora]|nr:hypothetical protein DFH27DRAFT_106013 [Peziza echinospora]